MKHIYKHIFILSLLLFSAQAYGQDYLFSIKDEVTAFLKERKIQYEEMKDNDSTTFIVFHNYDEFNNLQSSRYLTFTKMNNIFYCTVEELVMGYKGQYVNNFDYLNLQGFEKTNEVNEYGFSIYKKILNNGQEKIDLYASISVVNQDNGNSEDVLVTTYYVNPSQLNMTK